MINTEQTNIKKKNRKDVVGIKCYFSATGVRQWLSIIWSRSSGFIHIEWTTPREAITWLQSCSLIVPLSWPSEPSGQNLKSNLLTATWWLGRYTNSLADAEQFGHLLGVVVAGWHTDTMLKGSYASTPACDVSRIFFLSCGGKWAKCPSFILKK